MSAHTIRTAIERQIDIDRSGEALVMVVHTNNINGSGKVVILIHGNGPLRSFHKFSLKDTILNDVFRSERRSCVIYNKHKNRQYIGNHITRDRIRSDFIFQR